MCTSYSSLLYLFFDILTISLKFLTLGYSRKCPYMGGGGYIIFGATPPGQMNNLPPGHCFFYPWTTKIDPLDSTIYPLDMLKT